MQLNIFYLIYIGYIKPYQDKNRNRIDMLNEVFILILSYHMFTFLYYLEETKLDFFLWIETTGQQLFA